MGTAFAWRCTPVRLKRLLEGDVKGTWLAERSLKPGGIAVVISQSVEGQAPHYLVGRFGTDYGGPLWQRTVQPRVAQASRILVCSAYQSRVDLDSYGPPDRVVPCADWNEVSSHLHAAYPQGARRRSTPARRSSSRRRSERRESNPRHELGKLG